jgi:hypothetical protein
MKQLYDKAVKHGVSFLRPKDVAKLEAGGVVDLRSSLLGDTGAFSIAEFLRLDRCKVTGLV